MDPIWLDRDLADKTFDGVDWQILEYDPDTGLNCLNGEPFTGASKLRHSDGTLRALTQRKNGVAEGVSVAWYPSGQVHLYSEMQGDVYHGLHTEWNEDGTKRVEAHYNEGRLDKDK